MLDSLRPHGLQPARLLGPWESPGKNTGVGSHSLLQGNLPDPEIKPESPTLQANSLQTELFLILEEFFETMKFIHSPGKSFKMETSSN